VAELKAAGEEGKVRTVKGFAPKTEQKLLEAVWLAKKPRNEINIHKALHLGEEVLSYLQFADGVKQIEIAGSIETLATLDFDRSFINVLS
jgi:DNA polymerase (family X)